MGLVEVCAGGECERLQVFEDFHCFLVAGSSQIQDMEFQVHLEKAVRVHSGIVAGNKLFLLFHVFQKLLTQGIVVIEGSDDVFDEKAVHHQTDVKGIIQFVGCQCAHTHALVGGIDHQFFFCQTLQRLFDRCVADTVFSCQFFDVDFFSGDQLFIGNVFFNVRINLIG